MASVMSFNSCYAALPPYHGLFTLVVAGISGSLLSLFGSSFIVCGYLSVHRMDDSHWNTYFNRYEGITLMIAFLALSDYLSSINSLIIYIMIYFDRSQLSWGQSIFYRVWFQCAQESSFLWTLCIAVYLKSLVLHQVDILRESPRPWISFLFFSWGTPLGLSLIILGLGKFEPSDFGPAYPETNYFLVLWFIPLLLILLYIILTYLYLLYGICLKRKKKVALVSPDVEDLRTEVRILLYMGAYLVCWVLDFAGWFYYYLFKQCIPFELLIFSCFMHYLQGFLNTLVYGFTNRNYRELLSSNFWLITLFNILTAPIMIWPKGIIYLIFKIKSCFKKEDKGLIDYTTGEDSSIRSDIHSAILPTEFSDFYPELVAEINNTVQNTK